MFAQETSAQDLAVQSAYMQIIEKRHHKKEHTPSGKDIERVEAELEKAADEIKEELKEAAFDIDQITGKSKVSQAVMDRLHKAAQEYHDFVTPEFLDAQMAKVLAKKFSAADDKHAHIHKENDNNLKNGPIEESAEELLKMALIEALTDSDFEARAKVASSTKDADLLAAMAQTHMHEDAPGATEILNHLARNPATPKFVIEQLAKHSDSKVSATANSMLSAGVHGAKGPVDISPKIEEATQLDEMAGRTLDSSATGRVAKAFKEGKKASAGKQSYAGNFPSAYTDGLSYFLHGHEIAKKMENGDVQMKWAGWYTPTTERHLNTILGQVAPGKSVSKSQHRDQGVEQFLVKDL